jgi:hypothetical protein
MGGFGSGRRTGRPKKQLTECFISIDVRAMKREGDLFPGLRRHWQWHLNPHNKISMNVHIENSFIDLAYHCSNLQTGHWEQQTIHLETTPCHFGGERVWFQCPTQGCGRRVAVLYFANAFACRNCFDLAYKSQRESPQFRSYSRVDRTRKKLGWEPGLLNGVGWKPKGMHWKTFGQLFNEYEKELEAANFRLANSLGLSYSLDIHLKSPSGSSGAIHQCD